MWDGRHFMPGNMIQMLGARNESGNPLRVGLIGAGKLGSMFASQLGRVPGVHLLGVADLSVDRARAAMQRAGWSEERYTARDSEEALRTGKTYLTEDATKLIAAPGIEVVVEATGVPHVGITHALAAIEHRRHIVMLTAEADVLLGPLLGRRAAAVGVTYSMAYGDQPALICELVEWAQVCGFDVVCAGKGSRYLPTSTAVNPDNVWQYYGFSAERIARSEENPRLYTTFADGTKCCIESALVANATGLIPQPEGLAFPPCSIDDLPTVLRPRSEGGVLSHKGTVECVADSGPDGVPIPHNIRLGVYVVIEAADDFIKRSLREYGVKTDPSGRYAAMYRPYHLVGLELPVSIMRVGLLGQATGSPISFTADVVARAKKDLSVGEVLDGDGGYTVYGTLRPAKESVREGELPVELASDMRLKRSISRGEIIRWADVEYASSSPLIALRREMEAEFFGGMRTLAEGGRPGNAR
jgi:predicted homoserine dehydrogenase-like protein